MAFLTALRFLTALPLPDERRDAPLDRFGRSLLWFPLVGALLGLTLAGVDLALRLIFPLSVVNGLLLIVGALLTGGLHLDGLADACDGLFARVNPGRRLEIMRDSRVGGFGAAGVALLLLVQYSALLSVPADDRGRALVLAGLLSRWTMVQAIAMFPYAREQGLGRAFKDNAGIPVYGVAFAVTLADAWIVMGLPGVGAMVAAMMLCAVLGWYALTKLPGLTGDLYGAICEMTVVAVLLDVRIF